MAERQYYEACCEIETLHEPYQLAKAIKGAPGVDGITFKYKNLNKKPHLS